MNEISGPVLQIGNREISRRQFLRLAALAAAGLLASDGPVPDTLSGIDPETQRRASEAFGQAYLEIRSAYLLPGSSDGLRVLYEPDKQNSSQEVNAYVMTAAALLRDTDVLNRLWRHTQAYIKPDSLPAWLTAADGSVSDASAVSDGDEDTVLSLYFAQAMTGGYGDVLHRYTAAIMDGEVDAGNYPKPGDYGGGKNLMNPSYFDPLAYEIFGRVSENPRWRSVAATARGVMDRIGRRIRSGAYASYPDWVNSDTDPVPGPSRQPPMISYEYTRIAIRQLRAARLLTGPAALHAWRQVQTVNDFFQPIVSQGGTFDIINLKDGYALSGQPVGSHTLTAFTSAAAVAAMASADTAYRTYMFNQLLTLPTDYPYNAYIRMLALLTLSDTLMDLRNRI